MSSRAALLALVTVLAAVAAGCGRSAEPPSTFVVGAVEDAAKSGSADAKMLLARQAGFRAIVLSASGRRRSTPRRQRSWRRSRPQ